MKIDDKFITALADNLQRAASDFPNGNTRDAIRAMAAALRATLDGLTWDEAEAQAKARINAR